MPVIPTVQKWRQDDEKFKVSLGYTRPCFKKKKKRSESMVISRQGQEDGLNPEFEDSIARQHTCPQNSNTQTKI